MGTCKKCGNCCKSMVVELMDIDYDLAFLAGRDGVAKEDFGIIPCACRALTPQGLCSIWPTRPGFCRRFPPVGAQYLDAIGCKFYEEG